MSTTDELREVVCCAVCGSQDGAPARIRAPRDDHAGLLNLPGGRSRWVVCRSCGLVYQSPRPGPRAVARLYQGGTYHEGRGGVPEHYIQYSLRRSTEVLDWALSHAELSGTPGRALDIGCGIGGALVRLRSVGWEVEGIEPDNELAAVGRDRFGLEIHSGMLEAHSLVGRHFELAYSCHVWEHLADPVSTSANARRLVGPDGHLVIVVPTFRRARTLAWSCFTSPHTYMFTDVSLSNVLDQAGFDVVDHCYRSGADSELWLMARSRPSGQAARSLRPERPARVQRELALVPLRAPLGVLGRMAVHTRTLARNPRDFARRLGRWTEYRWRRLRAILGS